MGKILDNNYK